MFRNPMVAIRGPLERFQGHRASPGELLGLASPAAVGQLAAFREVFASTLLPQLARCPGRWILGPEFTGSTLLKADADLIAAGLLLDLKTDSRFSLGVTVLFQVIGYALLDFIRTVTCSSPSVLRSSYAPNPPGTGHVPAVCRIEIAHRERTSEMPNVNVTYAEMQSAARQLQAGEQTIEGDLSKLKRLVDNLVAAGYVTDASSRQFEASYTQFNTGATKMVQGLNGMGQYLDAAVKAFHETDTQLAASLKQ
jgi:WXG100 family type VII secretion target